MMDMMNVPKPTYAAMLVRQSKESPVVAAADSRKSNQGFPEYLKHTDLLGHSNTKLKLTACNSLFHAVLKGRLRGTRYLLDRTVYTINGRNDYGYSVLTAALHVDDDKRRDQLFRLLLDRGADPFFKDTYDRNVMHWACLLRRTQQVKTLLRDVGGDVDLNAKDRDSHTALHHAVMAGHLPIVTLLVGAHRKFGVTVDAPDKMGLTPYLHAKRLGYRDVAEHLHAEGQASQGHGDVLFRTPREWSQIGKFERKKAIEINTQEAINAAKIKGKITYVRHLEGSLHTPRMAMPNIGLPSYSPSQHPRVKLTRRYPGDRLSRSLPSLKEPLPSLDLRPSSASNGKDREHEGVPENGGGEKTVRTAVNPGQPSKEAFTADAGSGAGQTARDAAAQDSSRGTAAAAVASNSQPEGAASAAAATAVASATTAAAAASFDRNSQRSGSLAAFTLMEMNDKGRHARHFRHSQFDETKASEYSHMLGSLNYIMDIVSQQQSKSFRQSVRVQNPETPKKKKSKSKVSSLAVILGRDKSARWNHNKRSPKPSAAKKASAAKKENGAGEHKKKSKAPENKIIMPLLKVNDKIV